MNMKDVKQLGARFAGTARGKGPVQVDAAAIRELAELLDETGLGEIEIEQGGRRIRVVRANASGSASSPGLFPVISESVVAPAQPLERSAQKSGGDGAIVSPLVGTVYVAPEPGKPPFVQVGDAIRAGDTLLIVEAMKTMNPIVAPRAGTIREICVRDAEPVEFGQTLIVLSPAA
jgi:acetyl-CoA carboxylase biotin carboxyl carrier protein